MLLGFVVQGDPNRAILHAKIQAALDTHQLKLFEALQHVVQHSARSTALSETLTKVEQQHQTHQHELDRIRDCESQARARIDELQRQAEFQHTTNEREKSDLRREIEQLKRALVAAKTNDTTTTTITNKNNKSNKSKKELA